MNESKTDKLTQFESTWIERIQEQREKIEQLERDINEAIARCK